MTPVKTPVWLPFSPAGSIPERSKVSQAVSSSRRCCGSMPRASRGEIPKKPGSNRPASCRKPPWRTYVLPARSGSGSYRSSSQPRFSGRPEMASVPEATSRHRSSMPTMAIGSSAVAAVTARTLPVAAPASSDSSATRCSTSALGVG